MLVLAVVSASGSASSASVSWTTVLAAALGAAFGGVVTAMIQTRHERDADFRARMVEVGYDFSTGVAQALIGLNEAARIVGATDPHMTDAGELVPTVKEAVDQADELIDQAHARLARVALMFGDATTPTGLAAERCIATLRSVHKTLSSFPYDLEQFNRDFTPAFDAHNELNRAARRDIRGVPWYRSLWR